MKLKYNELTAKLSVYFYGDLYKEKRETIGKIADKYAIHLFAIFALAVGYFSNDWQPLKMAGLFYIIVSVKYLFKKYANKT